MALQPLQSLIASDVNANNEAKADQDAALAADAKATGSATVAAGLDGQLNSVLLSAAVAGNEAQLDGTQQVYVGVPGATKPIVKTVPLASTIQYDDGVAPTPVPVPVPDPNAPPASA